MVATEEEFRRFVLEIEPPVRRALTAMFGAEAGRSAAQSAFVWAWENWPRASELTYPAAYLVRVGCTAASRDRPRDVPVATPFSTACVEPEEVAPELIRALIDLSPQQRAGVLLVHGYGYPLRDAARILDISVATLRAHIQRGLTRLRTALEVTNVR